MYRRLSYQDSLMEDDTYRYTSWRENKSMSYLPDLIILNGICKEVDGKYYFENNRSTYCIAPVLNNSNLTICHAGKAILQQERTTTDTMLNKDYGNFIFSLILKESCRNFVIYN